MAAARHNPTRRALLGAALGAPALLAAEAAAPPPPPAAVQRWEHALSAYRRAETALQSFQREEAATAERAYRAVRDRWPREYDFGSDPAAQAIVAAALAEHEPFEAEFNRLASAQMDALRRLLTTPAPDLRALAIKIELAADQDVATIEGGKRCLAALKADGWRFASKAPSALEYCVGGANDSALLGGGKATGVFMGSRRHSGPEYSEGPFCEETGRP